MKIISFANKLYYKFTEEEKKSIEQFPRSIQSFIIESSINEETKNERIIYPDLKIIERLQIGI